MSEINNSEDKKKQQLWNMMLKLRAYVNEDYDEINEAVDYIYCNDPPLWLTDSLVFGPLISMRDNEIRDILESIKHQQDLLRIRIDGIKNLERRKQVLLDEISRLKSTTTTISESDDMSMTDLNVDLQIQEYDRTYRNERVRLHELEEEEEELEMELDECEQELDKARSEREIFQSQLLESSNIIKQFRKKNNEIQKFIKSIVHHKNVLHKRQKDLTLLSDSLLNARAENEKVIRRLEDRYAKHQQLVSSLEDVEDKIKLKEKKQEMLLAKMIEAVKMSELNKVEVLKQNAINQKLTNKVNRINELTRSSVKKLNEAIDDHQGTIVRRFENILSQLQNSVDDIKYQNKEIIQDRSVVQKRVDIAKTENEKLLMEKGDDGFEDFLMSLSRIQNEIEGKISQINQLKVTNGRVTDSVASAKTKILYSGKDCRNELASLKQKEENYQKEIEDTEEQCNEMIERNQKLVRENQDLRISIIEAQKEAERELKERLEEKKVEIDDMEREIKIAQEESRRAIENITYASEGYKKHADKWRCQLEIIGAEANDCISTISSNNKSKIDEIKQLQSRLYQAKQKIDEMQCKINESEKEMIIIKGDLAERKGRVRKYNRRIMQTEEGGMDYISLKDELARKSKALDNKINKLGAELYVLKVHSN